MSADLAERLEAWLPQTQCGRCGYPRCRDYAAALARGSADINRCPPGGETTIRALAEILGTAPKPLDPACGPYEGRRRARIEESECIGCAKCLDACPVDAIVGSRRFLHTVIAAECSGCGLCLPPCPVDCIVMEPVPAAEGGGPWWAEYTLAEAQRWRERVRRHDERLAADRHRQQPPAAARGAPGSSGGRDEMRARLRAEIREAVARVRARAAASKA
jgi:electron transport complex protein RnfB